jgi:Asp-tRNA(Asn)/Glu-tRNA(Gln) amidotransferase C subunit
MLRLALGAITVAASGYALKKYLEEDCTRLDLSEFNKDEAIEDSDLFNDHVDPTTDTNALEPLDTIRQHLNTTLFRETEGLMRTIKNLAPHERVSFDDMQGMDHLKITPQNKSQITSFCSILRSAEYAEHDLLDKLEKAFSNVEDIDQLSEEDKEKTTHLFKIDTLMREACQTPITFDGEWVSIIATRIFNQLYIYLAKNDPHHGMPML